MFALTETDLGKPIIGCGDGPAGFNAIFNRRGGYAVATDPLYQFNAAQIARRIDQTRQQVLSQVRQNAEAFVWTAIPSVEALGAVRQAAMAIFLADYAASQPTGRYVAAQLPSLPFADGQFELSLCSHVLFSYSGHFTLDFHVQAIMEMLRVAKEARIFPLLNLAGAVSPHLSPVMDTLIQAGFHPQLVTVGYEFQKGGKQMLKVQPAQ
ncbi:MAG: SAM-dependent methyltransferase [Candidatus Methylumidiphilus sp.]